MHDPSNNFFCEICSKQVKGKDGLLAHLKTHEVIRSEDRIQCNVCGNYQKDMKSYKVHIKKHSELEEDRICPECGKISASIKALKYHIKFVHQTSRTFQCQNCPKAFKKKIHLIDHNATHTGEDIYCCPFCPKTLLVVQFNIQKHFFNSLSLFHFLAKTTRTCMHTKRTCTKQNMRPSSHLI